MILLYRKRPAVIEAWEAVRHEAADIVKWVRLNGGEAWESVGWDGIIVQSLEGPNYVDWGDFVIRGTAGEFYGCKPSIFASVYEPVVGL